MAIGHPGNIVVMVHAVIGKIQTPDEITFPRPLLQAPTHTASCKCTIDAAPSEQTSVVQEVACAATVVFGGPALDDLTACINEVGVASAHGVEQGVARPRFFSVDKGPNGLGLAPDSAGNKEHRNGKKDGG